MSPLDYIDGEPEAYYTPEGRLRLTIRPGKEVAQSEEQGGSGPLTNVRNLVTAPLELGPPMRDLSQRFDAARNALAERGLFDKLLGVNGPRFQTWPERMVRSGFALPHDVMSGTVETTDPYGKVEQSSPVTDLVTGRTSEPVIQRVQDLANFALLGSLPAARQGALGTGGGRMTQPAIPKVEGPFYSAVENAVSGMKQDKMEAGQWLNWLRNQPGVKQEELDWLGLEGLKGPMTKAQVLEHVRGHGPEIKEIEKRGYEPSDDFIGEVATNAADQWADQETTNGRPPSTAEWSDQYRQIAEDIRRNPEDYGWEPQEGDEGGGTRYAQYQLPGGDNYRELLLTMPDKTNGLENPLTEAYGKGQNYVSSHWDEPNVLVHMRMNDRDIPDVGKTLHLEEVQSDWHQQGRKQGYRTADLPEGWKIEEAKNLGRFIVRDQNGEMRGYGDTREQALASMVRDSRSASVPDAPFKSTWADLALKRAISKAAREGYDAVSWTPGEQQATRYDLSKHFKSIKAERHTDGTFGLSGRDVHDNWVPLKQGVQEKDVTQYVGKDLAEKIIKQAPGKTENYMGLDLKVGGEGMKAFYDKMLVDKANALAKKFGGKVEWKELPQEPIEYFTHETPGQGHYVLRSRRGPEGEDFTEATGPAYKTKEEAEAAIPGLQKMDPKAVRVPVLRLTPKMKEAATGKGFPLFSSGLPFQFVPVDHDPFDDKLRGGDAT